ncbi:MAG: hypothetical protein ABEJ55_04355 [Halanaeroarchaeum sp.]
MTRSRGQILLIAALGIAVAVLALAVVANTALYAETLAARDTPDGGAALAFQESMESGAGDLLDLANRHDASKYATLVRRFEADVSALSEGAATQGALDGRVQSVRLVDVTNGSRILQNTSSEFTDADGAVDWTLAEDVADVRRFEIVTQRSSLNHTTGPSPFTVTVSDGSDTWRAEIAAADPNSIQLTVSNGVTTETCSVSGPTATVDLSAGRLNGTACSVPTIAETVSAPYAITVENGDAGAGRFRVYVEKTYPEIETAPYNPGAGTDPYLTRALFDATVEVHYEGRAIEYSSNTTVAPTEPPPGAVYR